jgi:tagatose-1,6-bisphosphate aldolase non-catalytic subunit AgaZ/GatZ
MLFAEFPVSGWLESIAQIGIVAFLLLFFVWQSSKEKAAMSQRISMIEDYTRKELSTVAKDGLLAINNSNRAISDNTIAIAKLCDKIDGMRNHH